MPEDKFVVRDNEGDKNRFRIDAVWGNANPLWPSDDQTLTFLSAQRLFTEMSFSQDHMMTLRIAEVRKLYDWLGPQLKEREAWEKDHAAERDKHDEVREKAMSMGDQPSPEWMKANLKAVELSFAAYQKAPKRLRSKRTK